jgi:diaminopimelate epimerase
VSSLPAADEIPVVLMHGAHNSFVVLDARTHPRDDYALLARRWCDPQTGVGTDGVLVVGDSAGAEAEMRIFNADGSEPEMCGNGVRCVARYLAERGAGDRFTIATLAGPISIEIVSRSPFRVRTGMGQARVLTDAPRTFEALGATWTYDAVSVGNPHIVLFVDDVDAIDLEALGAVASTHPAFPGGTNVHLVTLEGPSELRVRHYERGVGITQACGTGAVASVAAAAVRRGLTTPALVHVPGGDLEVELVANDQAYLTGPAEVIAQRSLAATEAR